jgi:arsenate reductase (glutaredoxin)
MQVTIYHNPQCGTSRKVLWLLREAGIEPIVIEYLQTPPSRATLRDLLRRMGALPRDILRRKGTPYDALGLADPALDDDALFDAIEAHPILIERPIIVAPHGVKLCRPAEKLFELLPALSPPETTPTQIPTPPTPTLA